MGSKKGGTPTYACSTMDVNALLFGFCPLKDGMNRFEMLVNILGGFVIYIEPMPFAGADVGCKL